MKKLTALLIACAIVLSVSGCSQSNNEAPAPSTTTTAASVTTPVESEKTTDTEATQTIVEDETEPVEDSTEESTEPTTEATTTVATTEATTTTAATTEATTAKPVETTVATTKKPVETTAATTTKPVVTTTTEAVTEAPEETEAQNKIPSGSASGVSIVDDYTKKYAYSTLSSVQKELYAVLFEGISSHTKSIDVSSVGANNDDLQKAFYSLAYDNHQFFWLGGGYTNTYNSGIGTILTVDPIYTRTKAQSEDIQKKLDSVVAKVTAEAMKKPTLFEQVLYLHDYIVNNTTYTTSGDAHISEADGPLLKGYALCEGYANAFGYLCQSIGVLTVDITGKANGGDHMWSLVKLGGNWYQFDVTFDDPTASTPVLSHDYFAITTAKMKQDHNINCPFYTIPNCTATEYNYYTAMSIVVYDNADEAYKAVIKAAAANFKKGVYQTSIICTEDCITAIWTDKYKTNIFTDLASYGCKPSSYKRNYKGTTYTLTLTP